VIDVMERGHPDGPETPERRLLLAVLEDAVGTYQRYALASDRKGQTLFREVRAWFDSPDDMHLYSFLAICEVVGLDAASVRRGLEQWADAQRARWLEAPQLADGTHRCA
jgi:hypothetical protein